MNINMREERAVWIWTWIWESRERRERRDRKDGETGERGERREERGETEVQTLLILFVEGRNIFDPTNHPNSVLGRDYDLFCPTSLDSGDQINRNRADFYQHFARCSIETNSLLCWTNKSLEQEFSLTTRGEDKQFLLFNNKS
jgi:hypothetical protein